MSCCRDLGLSCYLWVGSLTVGVFSALWEECPCGYSPWLTVDVVQFVYSVDPEPSKHAVLYCALSPDAQWRYSTYEVSGPKYDKFS